MARHRAPNDADPDEYVGHNPDRELPALRRIVVAMMERDEGARFSQRHRAKSRLHDALTHTRSPSGGG